MLTIVIPGEEQYDEEKNEVYYTKDVCIKLEHSLVSLAKWESKWEKPFMDKNPKTEEETNDYVRCMTLTQNVKLEIYSKLSQDNLKDVSDYIEAAMTATTFADDKKKANNGVITAEIIYYWMIALNVPVEFHKWHLNRLLALINVCNVKSQPEKKMTRAETMARNRQLNNERLAKKNAKG